MLVLSQVVKIAFVKVNIVGKYESFAVLFKLFDAKKMQYL